MAGRRRIKIKLQDTVPARVVFLEPDATEGATLGTDVFTPNGLVGTPATVRAWLNVSETADPRSPPPSGSGTNHHRLLQGLTLGDDHPQYTQWAQEETIIQSWDWRIGGVEQWDINDTRVRQTIPIHMVRTDDILSQTPWAFIEFQDVSSALAPPVRIAHDDFGSVHIVTNANYAGTANNFTRDNTAHPAFMMSLNQEFDAIVWHVAPAGVGTINWNEANAALNMGTDGLLHILANGTASAPAITVGNDPNSGMYQTAEDMLAFSTGGIERYTIQAAGIDSIPPFRHGGGSASAPAYTFWVSNDINTGMYRVAEDQLGFTTGATLRVTIANTAVSLTVPLRAADGTNALPAYSFQTDSNNGMYRVAEDQLGFSTGGTLRLTVSTAAIVSTLIHSAPLGATGTPTYSFTGDLNSGMWSPGADIVAISTNALERFRVANARVTTTVPIGLSGYTVATLPAGTVGDTAYVTDALAPAYGANIAGGGAVTVPVFYNGANWIAA